MERGIGKLLLFKKKLLLLKKKEKLQRRRFWVHPINKNRDARGLYTTLVQELRLYNDRHIKYFRMSKESFDFLLSQIRTKITKEDTNMRLAIEPALKLAVTLHHLAEGASHSSIAMHYRLGRSTVSQIIYDTCDAIFDVLQPIYLTPPQGPEEWKRIAEGFSTKWNFPNCIGCIDGKHVVIQKPFNCGSEYYNYKQRHSIVLMAICDASYRFVMIDVGKSGSNNDAGIWDVSPLCQGFQTGTINLPEPSSIPGDNANKYPYTLVGDEAFPLRTYMMRPYPGRSIDSESKKVFNYRLSRARRVIENSFGILTQRWRLLLRPIVGDQSRCIKLVNAMCVLHNFLCTAKDGTYIPAGYTDLLGPDGTVHEGFWRQAAVDPLEGLDLTSRSQPTAGVEVRERYREYFSGPGSLDWQWEHINRR